MTHQTLLEPALAIARHAGGILLANFRQPIARHTKSSDIDIVTAADRDSENYIVPELLKLTPEYHIVGEEGGGYGADRATAPFLWFVDPLDGTVNFASAVPHFAVTLTLTTPDMQPLLGIVYDPNRDEMFSAVQGGGAFLNNERIHVSSTSALSDALIASGFAYDRRTNPDNNLAQWAAFTLKVRDMRRFGAAALDLCYVASGRFDGFWERSLKPWDAVAGMLIVREAGGIVTDYEGNPNPHHAADGRYLAGNPLIYPQMHAVLTESYSR